jgi:hypothetical protein
MTSRPPARRHREDAELQGGEHVAVDPLLADLLSTSQPAPLTMRALLRAVRVIMITGLAHNHHQGRVGRTSCQPLPSAAPASWDAIRYAPATAPHTGTGSLADGV